jgi:1-acyl-sn-glycerol-3-phosphate acyltransferase
VDKFVGILRFLALGILVIFGLIFGIVSSLLPAAIHTAFIRCWHSLALAIVGVKSDYSGASCEPGALLVANHVSWLDIPVLGARYPALFLANAKISNWPVLGYMARKAGTLFIHRGKGSADAIDSIAGMLSQGQSVVIFPEGKTTYGLEMRKFQPRLFQAAINTGAAVQPCALRYSDRNGDRLVEVSFAGHIKFIPSLWKVVKLPGKSVEIHMMPGLSGESDRNKLSKTSENAIKNWIDNE